MLWHSLSLPDPSEGTGTGWLCSPKGGRHFPRKGESLSQKILLLKIKVFLFKALLSENKSFPNLSSLEGKPALVGVSRFRSLNCSWCHSGFSVF